MSLSSSSDTCMSTATSLEAGLGDGERADMAQRRRNWELVILMGVGGGIPSCLIASQDIKTDKIKKTTPHPQLPATMTSSTKTTAAKPHLSTPISQSPQHNMSTDIWPSRVPARNGVDQTNPDRGGWMHGYVYPPPLPQNAVAYQSIPADDFARRGGIELKLKRIGIPPPLGCLLIQCPDFCSRWAVGR